MTPAQPTGTGRPEDPRLPPHAVWRACLLVLSSLALSLLLLVPGITPERPGEAATPLLESLAVLALFGGLTVWLVLKVLQRRHWARWALFIYLALTWLMAAPALPNDFALSPVAGVIDGVSIAMEMAAVWGLFFGDGETWFGG